MIELIKQILIMILIYAPYLIVVYIGYQLEVLLHSMGYDSFKELKKELMRKKEKQ